MTRAHAGLALALSTLLACSSTSESADAGTSDAGPTDGGALGEEAARALISGYCDAVHGRVCAGMIACNCRLDVRGLDPATCATVRADGCREGLNARVLPDLVAGRARLDEARLASCLTKLDAMIAQCRVVPGSDLPIECQSAIVDSAALGAPCEVQGGGLALCAGGRGVCGPAACSPLPAVNEACLGALCAEGLSCEAGHCRTPGAVGTGCTSDAACATDLACGDDGKCREPGGSAATCARDAECGEGRRCVSGACSAVIAIGTECTGPADCGALRTCGRAPETRTCGDAAASGADCGVTQPCASGLACVDGKCGALPGDGEACVDGNRCRAGFACEDGTRLCRALPGEHGTCFSGDRFCADGFGCNQLSNTCERGGAAGSACLLNPPDYVCGEGLACAFESDGSICRARGAEGATCTSAATCAAALYCASNDKCAPRVASGGACPLGTECAGGLECVRAGATATCRAIPKRGEPCVEACADGLACVGTGGRCVATICTVP